MRCGSKLPERRQRLASKGVQSMGSSKREQTCAPFVICRFSCTNAGNALQA